MQTIEVFQTSDGRLFEDGYDASVHEFKIYMNTLNVPENAIKAMIEDFRELHTVVHNLSTYAERRLVLNRTDVRIGNPFMEMAKFDDNGGDDGDDDTV